MTPNYDCVALIASICINGPANVELVQNTVWSGARISIGGVNIISSLGSDNLQAPDTRQMSEHCVSKKCIKYTRACRSVNSGFQCKVYYVTKHLTYMREINFEAASMKEIENSWLAVYFVPYDRVRVNFQDLSFDNGSDLPPIDRSRPRRK